jgi:hypothetical protein
MKSWIRISASTVACGLLFTLGVSAQTRCESGALPNGTGEDLEVVGPCQVGAGIYKFGNVNIYGGGSLTLADAKIDFWASSILVEKGSRLAAGSPSSPIGSQGGRVTIHLYGADRGTAGSGIRCKTDDQCGIDAATWNSAGNQKVSLPGGVSDYFYQYQPLMYDTGDPQGYFGYKVLAVSYGGTLALYGAKGSSYGTLADSDSGRSWARLNASTSAGGTTLVLDRAVDWQSGDQIVVTTTDYLPGHSEQLTIDTISVNGSSTTITVQEHLRYPHNGQVVDLSGLPAGVGPDANPLVPGPTVRFAETRAAVALLTRSIRIVSAGDALDADFPDESTGYYFGGHTIIRQGAQFVQLQGVEFYQMGQGGRMGHYPLHFHMARRVPQDTLVADCSIDDSMTRWITLHATQGVTLRRNVGYKSIGHGYYLEDGTEIDNSFYSNIGILARAAVDNIQNPRKVPGILAEPFPPYDQPQENVPRHSDIDHPAVFWITNGYNDFAYNMAAGAGTCGACYWLVPASNSGMSMMQKWESYSAMQQGSDRASMTPLKRFEGNYCSTAMTSFQTVGNTAPCFGVVNQDPGSNSPQMRPIPTPYPIDDPNMYFPQVDPGGGRFATTCGDHEDCSAVPKCNSGFVDHCAVTVLDRYTTAFNWAETNFSAVWLRPQWYLMVNSVISDVQNGGLTFVTGGGYTKSDVVDGHWALVKKTAFIGRSQDPAFNSYASNAGPINPGTPLACATQVGSTAAVGNFCLLADEGVSFPMSNFGINQRLFNIYDGPAYQESNAYLRVPATKLEDCSPQSGPGGGACNQSRYLYARMMAVPKATDGSCYLPNAAIGWKQPNGFYYPPAFHSSNIFFQDVDIRHYLIEPRFAAGGLYQTDPVETAKHYCTWNPALFTNFTDVDRQTELSDDDGSLTGLVKTVSVNQDPFFQGPVATPQCASDVPANVPPGTATTSPYDYVSTAIIPDCGYNCVDWSQDCSGPACYGVPLYRQYILPSETKAPSIRMSGQDTAQRSSLTVNNGRYYVDTTVSADQQLQAGAGLLTAFQPNQTYYTMLLFAKPTTRQTYQLYVGPGFNVATDFFMARADTSDAPVKFTRVASLPSSWPQPQYEASTGLLTVTVDMSFPEFQTEYNAAKQNKCAPASFCSWQPATNSCGSSLPATDPLFAESNSVCSTWPVKDVDCPQGGCYAFGITLPAGFTSGPKPNLPPPPVPFPTDSTWTRPFVIAPPGVAGPQCYYPGSRRGAR